MNAAEEKIYNTEKNGLNLIRGCDQRPPIFRAEASLLEEDAEREIQERGGMSFKTWKPFLLLRMSGTPYIIPSPFTSNMVSFMSQMIESQMGD